ncbi:MAG TPA: hypothetical protein VFG89_10565 [Coriobacteriia bacterium]|nr:hypothetical protein [Coriobacteriia bacterium]
MADLPGPHPRTKRFRKFVAGVVLFFLGRGLVAAAKHDARVRGEVASWPDGTLITIAVAPDGPSASWRYEGGTLRYLGGGAVEGRPTLLVTYKSIDVALPVLLGRKGILEAFAEHRSTLAGDIGHGMSVVRCLHIVEGYLFPDIIAVPILPTRPVREVFFGKVYASLFSSSVQILQR